MPTLHWIGKEKVVNHHQEVPFKVLEHKYHYGVDEEFNKQQHSSLINDNSSGAIIHGDNLEALKALLPQYEGKIKCIYIDPPYNTGNEKWVYNDNVNHPKIKKWLGQVVGKESEDLSRHDKWLCMMYPRLKLLHKLLTDDGAIFISIDDNEQAHLKLICDEIFGAGNFIGQFSVKRQGGRQDSKFFASVTEYILCYTRKTNIFVAGKDIKENDNYPKFDKNLQKKYKTQLLRKWGANSLRTDRPNLYYPIIAPDGSDVFPTIYSKDEIIESCWRWSKKTMESAINDGRIEFIKDKNNNWIAYEKIFEPENGEGQKKFSTWIEKISVNGTDELKKIFGNSVFDYPKSPELLELILRMANTDPDSIILDSFAGSGTTAHAVLNLNQQDGGNRKFILIEMEDYAESITAERVRRVINGYADKEGTGGSFSFYELGQPLFDPEHNLNEAVGIEKIREYIWYSETKSPLGYYNDNQVKEKYLLGTKDDSVYYFIYEKDRLTTLDFDSLDLIKTKASQYIIYADNCLLPYDFMNKHNIIFKKIPRDINKL